MVGLKCYVTNLTGAFADTVIGAYHQLWHIEKSFRMSKHDLQARPIEECLEPVDVRHEALLLRVEVRDLRR